MASPLSRSLRDGVTASASPANRTPTSRARPTNPPPAAQGKRPSPSATKSRTSSKAFEELAKRADAARQADHPQEAIELYRQAVKFNPQWSEGWFYLGTLYYDANQYADAVPAFRRTVELTPSLGPSWAMLGLSEFEAGEYKNSLIHLQKSRTLGLTAAPSSVQIALTYMPICVPLCPFMSFAIGSEPWAGR